MVATANGYGHFLLKPTFGKERAKGVGEEGQASRARG